MYRRSLVVRTKLTPPRLHKRILPRPRVARRLLESLDYRLTIIQAGTGYGKSTALAGLASGEIALAWYHLDEEDADPIIFLLHLFHSLRRILPELSEAPLAILEGLESGLDSPWSYFVDVLVNGLADQLDTPALLVLDDVHLLRGAPEVLRVLNRFVARAPTQLHVILATRYPLDLPNLLEWQVKGAVLEIGQAELAFTTEEIARLFKEHYDLELDDEDVRRIVAETEGWAIALQLLWQGLRSGAARAVPQLLEELAGPTEQFFAYLAQEVLAQQHGEVQEFLRVTAVLREMTPAICDCLRDAKDSESILRYLSESGLFVVDLGGGHLRYHHLFREFLYRRQSPYDLRLAHRRAAGCWRRNGDREEAIYHLLAANAFDEAAQLIAALGRDMVQLGRLDTLAGWINALPPEILDRTPHFLIYQGDIARLRSRFEEALRWYRQAEQRYRSLGDAGGAGKALRGQARIYLDTVNPSQAEHLLQEALRISDGQKDRESRANLLELMAENRLNLGRPEEAGEIARQARELREEGPGEAELAVRVLLRTGQLDQARRILEKRAAAERDVPVLRPRSHRETLLLLALILVFQGEGDLAYTSAVKGTERGRALNSPFITAVGYMRQGHTWLLLDEERGYDEACRCYRETIKLSDSLAVPRLKVEAYWGLCRAHGFRGAVDAAQRAAEQGVNLARQAGDEWIEALIYLALGASYFLSGRAQDAGEQLTRAWNGFFGCSDAYGQALTRLWQCLLWLEGGDEARLVRGLEDLWALVGENHYDYLFTSQVLQGPPDPRRLVPLLLKSCELSKVRAQAERLLGELGLSDVAFHPGYRLRVQTLGPFRVWRGPEPVDPQGWRRENARLLFLVLLTYRRQMLDRDQILDLLWPDADPETALRDFKVALSTLFKVLEPGREAGAPSSYVVRDGTLYGLRPEADLVVDADRFAALVAEGDQLFDAGATAVPAAYRWAMALYAGDYLQEYPYAEWCREERERLRVLYLRAGERLAEVLLDRGEWEETVEVTQALLACDDCWEHAYRLQMVAYARMGNRAQALRAYQRCAERLRTELDVEPAPATLRLYAALNEGRALEDLGFWMLDAGS